jgi:hypothetical protein
MRDSVSLIMTGVSLPSVNLDTFGGRLDLGEGRSAFSLRREGNQIEARMRWSSGNLTWTGAGGGGAADLQPESRAEIGSGAWARDLVWRALSGMSEVELDMALVGDMRSPSLSVASNLGDAVAASLRRELGREIDEAEARVRAEVDRRIQPLVQDARGRVDALTSGVGSDVAEHRREVEELRARLEARVAELVR